MNQEEPCCPLLNDSDLRCSANLRLDRMDMAFKYCFGDYHACPLAVELLADHALVGVGVGDKDSEVLASLPVLREFERCFSCH
ncbi:MAG: hypothetical protein ABSH20_23965 [Tepidisphaeraceae bacterium]|jgi:hypothetical protein